VIGATIAVALLLGACTWHEPKPEFEAMKLRAEEEKWAKLDVARYSEFILGISMIDGIQRKGPFHGVFAAGPGFVCPEETPKVCRLSPDWHEVTIYHMWERGSHRVLPSEPPTAADDAAGAACVFLLALCVGAAIAAGAVMDSTDECEVKIGFTPALDRYYGVDIDESAGGETVLVRIVDVQSGAVAGTAPCAA
jgi:hypothetical protein